jgi:hypothetical protein
MGSARYRHGHARVERRVRDPETRAAPVLRKLSITGPFSIVAVQTNFALGGLCTGAASCGPRWFCRNRFRPLEAERSPFLISKLTPSTALSMVVRANAVTMGENTLESRNLPPDTEDRLNNRNRSLFRPFPACRNARLFGASRRPKRDSALFPAVNPATGDMVLRHPVFRGETA